ncbi:MAG: Helix-turn-helix domain [Thermoleophilia bacterium]|nr:Helix-turn-helix domain [Thermoleophilia bacterium]
MVVVMDVTNIMLEIASRIRSTRIEAGMSLEELARSSGLGPARVADIESGSTEPTMTEFVRLADALNVPAAQLVPAD